ncbi:MAG: ATP-binding protein [Oscillospiraceae bacterium]|nr:ATP-binding protein [Oscillospiraceae bacterium]
MVKLIMGLKGSGKTKTLVDLVIKAVAEESGDVVCIEKDKNLTYDIPYTARLIHASEYGINTNNLLRGFICGLHAGNYDITHVFIDNFYKLLDDSSPEAVADMLDWMEDFSKANSINFTITATDDVEKASDRIKRYF